MPHKIVPLGVRDTGEASLDSNRARQGMDAQPLTFNTGTVRVSQAPGNRTARNHIRRHAAPLEHLVRMTRASSDPHCTVSTPHEQASWFVATIGPRELSRMVSATV